MTDDFLPPDYKVPDSGGQYLKLSKAPETRFRILARPIMGMLGWKDKKPIRKQMGEEFAPGEVTIDANNRVSHFWAMPVYDYGTNSVRILEVTQSTVQGAIEKLAKNPKWGSPLAYDLCVVKTGEGLDTEYSTMPEPKAELSTEAQKAWEKVQATFSLAALFTGGDPFNSAPQSNQPPSAKKFFAMLSGAVKDGIYHEEVLSRDDAGKDERRKLLAELLGFAADPTQMDESMWQAAVNKLDAIVKANSIPF